MYASLGMCAQSCAHWGVLGSLIVNPITSQLASSTVNLTFAGTETQTLMVELVA